MDVECHHRRCWSLGSVFLYWRRVQEAEGITGSC